MNVRVVPGAALTPEMLARWRTIQEAHDELASPYFSPEFTQLMASVRSDVEVGVMHDGDRIVGFFPFQRGRLGVGRPVGAGYADHQGAIVEPGFALDARQLLHDCGLAMWHFDHLLASQAAFQRFHAVLTESPVVDVSRGLPAYLQDRRRAGRRESGVVERKMRKLEREQGPLRFEVATQDPAALATLLRWKRDQYARTGVADVLAASWIRDALASVQTTRTDGFAGLLSCLYVEDRLIAAHLGIRSRSVWHWWFPAYDDEVGRYSPGLILFLHMIGASPGMGIQTIDLGKGEERYKKSLMTGAVPIAAGTARVRSAVSAAWTVGRASRAVARRVRRSLP